MVSIQYLIIVLYDWSLIEWLCVCVRVCVCVCVFFGFVPTSNKRPFGNMATVAPCCACAASLTPRWWSVLLLLALHLLLPLWLGTRNSGTHCWCHRSACSWSWCCRYPSTPPGLRRSFSSSEPFPKFNGFLRQLIDSRKHCLEIVERGHGSPRS